MALKRSVQAGLKIEVTEGTENAILAADCAVNVWDVQVTGKAKEHERPFNRPTLTPLGVLKGCQYFGVSFMCEAAGGTATTDAVWNRVLAAAGMKGDKAWRVKFTGSSSPTPGELVGDNATQGSATKIGIVVYADVKAGVKRFWCRMLKGSAFASTDTITLYRTGGAVTLTPTANADEAGRTWMPQTEIDDGTTLVTPDSVTFEARTNGQRQTVVGVRGNAAFMIEHGKPITIKFDGEGLGLGEIDGNGNWRFRRAGPLTGVPALTVAPKVAKGYPVTLGTFAPVATKLEVNLNNTIAQRETLGVGVGAVTDAGYFPPRITGRAIRVQTDPEQPAVAIKDFMAEVMNGTTQPMYAQAGGVGDANGAIVFVMPAVQLTGDASPGERNNLLTFDLNGICTGSADDELIAAHLFDPTP